MLTDAARQGLVSRNVAEHVDHVAVPHKPVDTYTEGEVLTLLAAIAGDWLGHAWELALTGLRRGELAGLRWADVDLDAKTLSVVNKRVSAGGRTVEGDPKSATSRRTLPLPDRLVLVLKAARARQAAEQLALGPGLRVGGLRGVQRGRRPVLVGSAVPLLARRREGCRGAAHQAARCSAHRSGP